MRATPTVVDCCQPSRGASLSERFVVWLRNLWHWRTAWAVKHLSKQLQRDPGFRESWHANIAVSIQDEMRVEVAANHIGQANYLLSNRMADRLMKHLFNA